MGEDVFVHLRDSFTGRAELPSQTINTEIPCGLVAELGFEVLGLGALTPAAFLPTVPPDRRLPLHRLPCGDCRPGLVH